MSNAYYFEASAPLEDLIAYGWTPALAEAFLPHEKRLKGCLPGRILAEHRQHYLVQTHLGEGQAVISGSLRYHTQESPEARPAVGDWVVLSETQGRNPQAPLRYKIHGVLPRQSKISRKASGQKTEEQVIGTNLDTLFIVTSLNQDLNPRRLERYLALAQQSQIQPVLVLNKADLCHDIEAVQQELEAIVGDTPVVVLSALEQSGLQGLAPYLGVGKTLALVGSSGVGKSTLLNALLGEHRQATQDIRSQDARGRHTTVHRQLFLLPDHRGLILDAPGFRELQLWDSQAVQQAFGDIQDLISQCRYRNCRHDKELDCAVQSALESGLLDKKRWRNYLKLSDEQLYLEQRKARMRDIQSKVRAKRAYKKARTNALYGALKGRQA